MYRIKLLIGVLLIGVITCAWSTCLAQPVKQVLLPEPEVREAVERYLTQKLEGRGWETAIRYITLPSSINIPSGPREIELIVPPAWEGWGAVNIALVVRVNGVVEKNITFRLHVDARTEMVVAARQISPGTVLTAEDIQLQKGDLAQAGGYPLTSISDAIGKKTRVSVRVGNPVKGNQLATVPVIVSGQLVTIIAENSGIRITASGRAKSAGGIGDVVRVQNISSGKEIPARVVDASTVEVGF